MKTLKSVRVRACCISFSCNFGTSSEDNSKEIILHIYKETNDQVCVITVVMCCSLIVAKGEFLLSE